MVARFVPAFALASLLYLVAGSDAQPPRPVAQPPGQSVPAGVLPAALPVVPPSAGAFITLKVSALAAQSDLKPVLLQLAKQPDALAGITEAVGVSPLELDRVTLFWPRFSPNGGADPVLVVSTREPFNEARVLKTLRADPVFDGDRRGRGFGSRRDAVEMKPNTTVAPAKQPSGVDPLDPDGKNQNPKVPADPVRPKEPDGKPPAPPLPTPPGGKQDGTCGAADEGGIADPIFYTLERGPFAALFLIDEHTLVFLPGGPDGDFAIVALLAANLKKNATGPLADVIAMAGKHTLAAGAHLTPLFREFDRQVPPDLRPYAALFAARTATLTGNLDKSAKFELTLKFDDATAAKRAAPVLEEGIAAVVEKMGEWVGELRDSNRPFDKSVATVVTAFTGGLKKAVVKPDGATVTATAEVDAGPVVAKAVGDLLQAVQSRRKAELRSNNLKQIGLALHGYLDANGSFPANVYGPKGEPLLSWRVHLLPYLEQEALYRQFKMDEAWDGPNNKALIEKMPKVYFAPDREHAKGKTFYQGFIGPDPQRIIVSRPWLLRGDKNGLRINDITDGLSNTIAVIEAREGVIWSKPDDLPFGGAVPLLGEKGWDRTPALRFDGSVMQFPTNIKPDLFWPYITVNGGEVPEDLEDNRLRRPFGGEKYVPHPMSPTPTPTPTKEADPAPMPKKPPAEDGADLIDRLRFAVDRAEKRLAAEMADLRLSEARIAIHVGNVESARALLKIGTVTKEELALAEAKLQEGQAALQSQKRQVELCMAELKAAKAALEQEKARPKK